MNRKIVSAVILVSLVAVFAFQGCMGNGPNYGPSGGGTSSGTGNSVEIKNFAFNPSTLNVSIGTTVTWYNNDTTDHTVTSDDGMFASSGHVTPGSTYTVTFNNAGNFSYHCSIHTYMQGKVVVQ